MRFLVVLSLVICLGAVIALAADSNDNDGSKLPETRRRFQLPKLPSYDEFKKMFHKSYNSITESLMRKKLFIARVLKAIVSSVKYKHNKSSYYLKVNQRSDWTQNEMDASLSISGGSRNDSHPVHDPGTTISTRASRTKRYDPSNDEVYVDLRRDKCMFPVRDQGRCAACYAFTHAAMLEHLFCKATGRLMAISEQYIIDCGPLHHEGALQGCKGGKPYFVAEFVSKYGIEMRNQYPYVAKTKKCPYGKSEADIDPDEMGLFKINAAPVEIKLEHLAYVLNQNRIPLAIGIGTRGSDFGQYGGGVHDMQGCRASVSDHSVLVIGHGREDGEEYWLIRNSYGDDWGENGYYKLAKDADCIFGTPITYGYGGRVGINPSLNKENNQTKTAKRRG